MPQCRFRPLGRLNKRKKRVSRDPGSLGQIFCCFFNEALSREPRPLEPSPKGPRPYHEGKDAGGVGSRVGFWTWPALEAACARVLRPCALVLVPGVGVGARHSWCQCIVARMRKLPLATNAPTMTLVCWSQRCFALLAAQPDLPSSTSAS
jgi:hypothetical protein